MLTPDGTWMVVEPYAGHTVADNLNPVGRVYYSFSTFLCVPNALSQDGYYSLGAQAGEEPIRGSPPTPGTPGSAGWARHPSTSSTKPAHRSAGRLCATPRQPLWIIFLNGCRGVRHHAALDQAGDLLPVATPQHSAHPAAIEVIKLTTSQHQPREPRLTRRSFLWRALRRGARAIRDFHREQVRYGERYYLASRATVPGDGPLAWVRTLDGYRLARRHLPSPAETGLTGPAVGEGSSFTGGGNVVMRLRLRDGTGRPWL